MNIVVAGNKVQVYGEDVRTYKNLPNGCYNICFNQMTGFYLSVRDDLYVNEDKIYGNHQSKVDKVMRSFDIMNRNFGVILSGYKGCGKSLIAKLIAHECYAQGIPVITATEYYPGIADFISSIDQKVMVLFDEFEKTFGETERCNPQIELLSLFDGIDNGNKLFVITCNETRKLNEYLLNRPGRFHYHFNITNPSADEISAYLTDKLDAQYHDVIPRISRLSSVIDITYDYLRAIVFEINQGYSVEETFNDLNITRGDTYNRYNIKVVNGAGEEWNAYGINLNIFSQDPGDYAGFSLYNKTNTVYVRLLHKDIIVSNGVITALPSGLVVDESDDPGWTYGDNPEIDKKITDKWGNCKSITLERVMSNNNVRYAL